MQYAVRFDKSLQPGLLDPTNYTVTDGSTDYYAHTAAASGTQLTLQVTADGPGPLSDAVYYNALNPDLLGVDGDPVRAFSFPLPP